MKKTLKQRYIDMVGKTIRVTVVGSERLCPGCIVGYWSEDEAGIRLMLREMSGGKTVAGGAVHSICDPSGTEWLPVVALDSREGPRRLPDMRVLEEASLSGAQIVFLNFRYGGKLRAGGGSISSLPLPFSQVIVQVRPISELAAYALRSGDKRALAVAIHAI